MTISALPDLLDRIFRIRQAFAYESLVTGVLLDFASLPKTLRPVIETQTARLADAARGTIVKPAHAPDARTMLVCVVHDGFVDANIEVCSRWSIDHAKCRFVDPVDAGSEVAAAVAAINAYRVLANAEADVIESNVSYKTFPESRRQVAEDQIVRLRAVAEGREGTAYAAVRNLDRSLRGVDAPEALTVEAFRSELATTTE